MLIMNMTEYELKHGRSLMSNTWMQSTQKVLDIAEQIVGIGTCFKQYSPGKTVSLFMVKSHPMGKVTRLNKHPRNTSKRNSNL